MLGLLCQEGVRKFTEDYVVLIKKKKVCTGEEVFKECLLLIAKNEEVSNFMYV